jgi:Zn-dependent protease
MPLEDWIVRSLMWLIPLLLSLSVHEWAHAWMAWRLGDDTAKLQGRLTLNPLAHIDPMGTLLLPLMGVPFGWAKPVPINPIRFGRQVSLRTGVLLTAVAGPLSNIVLAVGCIALWAVMIHFRLGTTLGGEAVFALVERLIYLNVLLAAFNLIPIPPLDGSRVVDTLLPDGLRPAWDSLGQMGPIALAAVILLPLLAGVSLFAWPLEAVQTLLDQLAVWLG